LSGHQPARVRWGSAAMPGLLLCYGPGMNRTVTQRIADRALEHRQQLGEPSLELFDVEWDQRSRPRRGVPLFRWIGQHSWPAQLVLWTGLLTLAYLLLIFGLALGGVALGAAWSVLAG
jgi:hypothetical protein